jgi:hypothetical protein
LAGIRVTDLGFAAGLENCGYAWMGTLSAGITFLKSPDASAASIGMPSALPNWRFEDMTAAEVVPAPINHHDKLKSGAE